MRIGKFKTVGHSCSEKIHKRHGKLPVFVSETPKWRKFYKFLSWHWSPELIVRLFQVILPKEIGIPPLPLPWSTTRNYSLLCPLEKQEQRRLVSDGRPVPKSLSIPSRHNDNYDWKFRRLTSILNHVTTTSQPDTLKWFMDPSADGPPIKYDDFTGGKSNHSQEQGFFWKSVFSIVMILLKSHR